MAFFFVVKTDETGHQSPEYVPGIPLVRKEKEMSGEVNVLF